MVRRDCLTVPVHAGRVLFYVCMVARCFNATARALDIAVTYGPGVDESQRQAVEYACSLWEGWITSSGSPLTLRLRVDIVDLHNDEDAADAAPLWRGHVGDLALTPAQYMAQGGSRLDEMDGEIRFNSRKTWYSGLDGNPGQQRDLVAHTLHEIGHQMGVECSFTKYPLIDWGEWGYYSVTDLEYYLTPWDVYLSDGDGRTAVPGPIPSPFDATGGGVTFNGIFAASTYGQPVPVYAPDKYAAGSSLVHVDWPPSPDKGPALMNEGVAVGIQGLWDYEVGIFTDLGWTFVAPTEVHATARGIGMWWHDGSAWTGGLPPRSQTAVYIDAPSPSSYTIFVDKNVSARTLGLSGMGKLLIPFGKEGTLNVGEDCVNDARVEVRSSGSFLVGGDEFIGRSGDGYFTQSGGTHSVGQTLYFGQEAGSKGSYDLSGTSSLQVGHDEFIGYAGLGYFTQSGGSHTVHDTLYLGREAESSGSYELSANGTLAVGLDEFIGYSGSGVFDQSGGTHTVGNTLYLGREAGSGGAYWLRDGGTLAVGSDEFIGYPGSGAGFFGQGEGTHHTVGNNLYLAWAAVYSLYNATLAVGSDEYICYSGVANFSQHGGSHTVSGSLYLGTVPEGYPIAGGIYQLWGDGRLAVGLDEFIGYAGTGRFDQDSGTHTVGNNLYLAHQPGSVGEYFLGNYCPEDATLLVGSDEFIGYAGEGGFSQVSGTHTVMGNLFLAFEPGSTGTYGLAGGMLSVHGGLGIRSGGDLYIGHPEWSPDRMGGKLSLYGGLTVESGGDLYNRGEVLIGPSVTASNAGRIAQDGESVVTMMGFADSLGSNTASLENLAGGLYDLQGDGDIVLGPSPSPDASVRPDQNLLNNYGTFRKSGGSGESVIEAKFTNSGLLDVQSGTLSFSGGFTQTAGATTVKDATITSTSPLHILGGSIGGTGQILADIWNEGGIVSPGFSPGTLTIDGDYTQGPDATLLLEIAGLQPGQSDVFNVAGTATLDGFLEISLLDGFQPLMGDTFPIFTYGSLLGAFDSIYVMGLPGYEFIPTYGLDQLTLLTGNVPAAIPAPSSLCLVAVGVVSLLSRLRKRRTGSGAGRAAS